MIIKQKNIYLYYFATALATIKVILNTSMLIEIPEQIDNIFTIFIAIMFFLKLLSQTYTKKQIFRITAIGILILYASIVSNELVIMLSYLAIISMQYVKVKNVVKIMLPIKIFLVLIHIFAYIITGDFKVGEYFNAAGEIRHTLLLGHPNTVAGILMWISMEYIYLKYERIKTGSYIFLIILSYSIYLVTRSRTILLVSIFFIVILFIEKHINNTHIFIKLSRYVFLFLSIMIISMSLFYDKIPQIDKVDDLLSRRVSLGKVAIDEYGIAIIPQKISYNTIVQWEDKYTMYLVLDSIYTRSAVSYGMLVLGLLILGFYRKNQNITNKEAIFIIMFALTGITENYILNAYLCFPLLFLGTILYNKNEKEVRNVE